MTLNPLKKDSTKEEIVDKLKTSCQQERLTNLILGMLIKQANLVIQRDQRLLCKQISSEQ